MEIPLHTDVLLLAKNDAFTYNGDLFKTGRVRISLHPNPFAEGEAFRQTLDLSTGSIRIEAGGIRLRIWADANRPVYHVQINSPGSTCSSAQRVTEVAYRASAERRTSNMAAASTEPGLRRT